MVWDLGTYQQEQAKDVSSALGKGELKLTLHGSKLRGSWVLVKTRDRQWLLIKHRDSYATESDVTLEEPRSALSGRLLADIAADEGGHAKKAAAGDPPKRRKKGK